MKKTLVAVAVIGAMAFIGSDAYAAQAGTSYVGGKVGWSHTETPARRHDAGISHDQDNDWAFGAYGGYNLTSFLGVELGYDYLGTFSNKGKNNQGVNLGDYTVHGTELSAIVALPFNDTDDVFVKLGALFANTHDDKYDHTDSKVTPLIGLGARMAFGDLIGRIEYDYAHKLPGGNYGYQPDLSALFVGMEYKFGGYTAPAPVAAPAPAPAPEPKTVVVQKDITLDSTALFAFNKSNLSSQGKESIAKVTNEINSNNLKNVNIKVEGHTDRIGSDSYNMKLSKDRARSVVEEFVADGINPNSISAEGYGETRPVTGNSCNGIKNKNNLVKCLAPDRRVEVKFSGIQEVEKTE